MQIYLFNKLATCLLQTHLRHRKIVSLHCAKKAASCECSVVDEALRQGNKNLILLMSYFIVETRQETANFWRRVSQIAG